MDFTFKPGSKTSNCWSKPIWKYSGRCSTSRKILICRRWNVNRENTTRSACFRARIRPTLFSQGMSSRDAVAYVSTTRCPCSTIRQPSTAIIMNMYTRPAPPQGHRDPYGGPVDRGGPFAGSGKNYARNHRTGPLAIPKVGFCGYSRRNGI